MRPTAATAEIGFLLMRWRDVVVVRAMSYNCWWDWLLLLLRAFIRWDGETYWLLELWPTMRPTAAAAAAATGFLLMRRRDVVVARAIQWFLQWLFYTVCQETATAASAILHGHSNASSSSSYISSSSSILPVFLKPAFIRGSQFTTNHHMDTTSPVAIITLHLS